MWKQREERRRENRRAFRPSLDGRLEPRLVLSRITPPGVPGQIDTAANGSAVELTTRTGQTFYVLVNNGTVRAFRMSGGRFGLIVDGTNIDSDLTISPLLTRPIRGTAHTFNRRISGYNRLINIGSITVNNGTIGNILGYRTAVLSGPIVVNGPNRVDRIAFDSVTAGASIFVGGDLNSFDVLNNLTISGPNKNIVVGRDLNWLNVGGNLTVSNGANFVVQRDLGLVAQPAKGTGPAGQGALIGGSLLLSGGSKFVIQRSLDALFLVNGATSGATGLIINGSSGGSFVSRGGITP